MRDQLRRVSEARDRSNASLVEMSKAKDALEQSHMEIEKQRQALNAKIMSSTAMVKEKEAEADVDGQYAI